MPADVLTAEDQERIRYHLGYGETSSGASIMLGMPISGQTSFLLESAISQLVTPFAVRRCKELLCEMERIESEMSAARKSLAASQVGDMQLHPLREKGMLVTDSLEKEYVRFGHRLANLLRVPVYPYAERYRGRRRSVPVRS